MHNSLQIYLRFFHIACAFLHADTKMTSRRQTTFRVKKEHSRLYWSFWPEIFVITLATNAKENCGIQVYLL